MAKNSSQNGSALVVTIIILAVAIVGVLGFVFWQNFIHKEEPAVNQTDSLLTKESEEKNNLYTFEDAVASINKVLLKEACRGDGLTNELSKADFKQVGDSDQFEYEGGVSRINNDFTYAFVQYGCGSSGSSALLKRDDTGWKLISEDARIYPMCVKVRNLGFPSSIIDKCYIDDNATDPVEI